MSVEEERGGGMDKATVSNWLQRYVEAWRSYDPAAIGDLFSEDAEYRFKPDEDTPVKGRDAIVANWLEEPDLPRSWAAHYEPFAVEGDRAAAAGWTHCFEDDGITVEKSYYNVWLLVFDNDGRCKDFTELYMETANGWTERSR